MAEGQTSLKTELDALKEECMSVHAAAYPALGVSDLASYTPITYVQTSATVVSTEVCSKTTKDEIPLNFSHKRY